MGSRLRSSQSGRKDHWRAGGSCIDNARNDRDGFDQWDKRIIETLIYKFNGGPVGLSSLAVAVGEEAGTLEEVNEPYLIMEGYVKRTAQGRVALPNAYRKLGLKPPIAGAQSELFSS